MAQGQSEQERILSNLCEKLYSELRDTLGRAIRFRTESWWIGISSLTLVVLFLAMAVGLDVPAVFKGLLSFASACLAGAGTGLLIAGSNIFLIEFQKWDSITQASSELSAEEYYRELIGERPSGDEDVKELQNGILGSLTYAQLALEEKNRLQVRLMWLLIAGIITGLGSLLAYWWL